MERLVRKHRRLVIEDTENSEIYNFDDLEAGEMLKRLLYL